ncbi:hypothetical protein [Sphingomonas mucosissima]|uniref:hypothetical protein n=1 Tax=Sphingomonas mucosissima TaxID=370959 RepID=UPI00146ED67C|nr:hypothetical protein [Sphingomonas mucosissima]
MRAQTVTEIRFSRAMALQRLLDEDERCILVSSVQGGFVTRDLLIYGSMLVAP